MGQSCCTSESKDPAKTTNIHIERDRNALVNQSRLKLLQDMEKENAELEIKESQGPVEVNQGPNLLYNIEGEDEAYHWNLHVTAK